MTEMSTVSCRAVHRERGGHGEKQRRGEVEVRREGLTWRLHRFCVQRGIRSVSTHPAFCTVRAVQQGAGGVPFMCEKR